MKISEKKDYLVNKLIIFFLGIIIFLPLKWVILDMIIPHKMSFSITNSSSADISQVKIKSGLGGLMEINSIPKDGHIEKTAWMKPGECWSFEYMSNKSEIKKVQLSIYKFNSKINEIIIFDDSVLLDGRHSVSYKDIECRN